MQHPAVDNKPIIAVKSTIMNLKHVMLFTSVLMGVLACSQPSETSKSRKVPQMKEEKKFQLKDFLGSDKSLDQAVEEVFKQLDDTAIVAQLVMPYKRMRNFA